MDVYRELAEALASDEPTRITTNQHGTFVTGKAKHMCEVMAKIQGLTPQEVFDRAMGEYFEHHLP